MQQRPEQAVAEARDIRRQEREQIDHVVLIGLGVFAWIRFIRFPPFLQAYERQLAKQRYFDRRRFSHPETTIRSKDSRSPRDV